jgi:hypothetical protein
VINTLGPHVEKGEPDWSAVKIRYEEPKTLALPVTAGTPPRSSPTRPPNPES